VEERRAVRIARLLVIVFGLVLGVLAFAMDELSRHFGSILELALTMATFTQGALLAGFALALLAPRIGGSGFMWSAPYSSAFVFALAWHGETARTLIVAAAITFFCTWFFMRTVPDLKSGEPVKRVALQFAILVLALLVLVWIQRHGLVVVEKDAHTDSEWLSLPVAFPWYVPIASTLAFVLGLVWARDEGPTSLEFAG